MSQKAARGKQQDGENHVAENEETTRGGFNLSKEGPEIATPLNETKMGSADSASSTHGRGSSCGLVRSLFPNSCRDRAESFARCLHRRLSTLGGEGNSSDNDERVSVNTATETSWLQAAAGQRTTKSAPSNSATCLSPEERVLERQPRHRSESDIYYDFDSEDHGSASTLSPAEMANAAELEKIHVNSRILKSNHHEACHCSPGPRPPDASPDPESGYVFSSPLTGLSPDTDNSEAYFDPESSETSQTFFDPQGSSESDAASNGAVTSNICKFSECQRADREHESGSKQLDENSESSSSSCNPGTLERARPPEIPVGCSSDESINGRSSLETTSPSHESLWSTFDDSTMSLKDESPSSCNSVGTRLERSHSDSEIPGNSGTPMESLDEVDCLKNQHVNVKNPAVLPAEICRLRLDGPVEQSTDGLSVTTAINDLSTCDRKVSTFDDQVNIRIRNSCGHENMSKLVERLNPNVDVIEDELADGDEEKKEEKIVEDLEGERVSEDEEDNRPQRVRRCSSLKTGKTPPATPGRKKIVRFADVLGLDLADVRTFLDEIPKVPNSAYSDLIYDDVFQKDSSPVNFSGSGPASFTTPLFAAMMKGPMDGLVKLERILVPLFQQPGGLPNFLDLVREGKVCLENVVVQDPVTMCLKGTVRVRNLDFHKSVHVRYSMDSWRNFSDLRATYATNSCDGFSDKFTFALYCHTLKVGQRLELAVRFQCKGSQYWDNNAGINYCFQCLPASNPTNSGAFIPITAPATRDPSTHEWSPMFY